MVLMDVIVEYVLRDIVGFGRPTAVNANANSVLNIAGMTAFVFFEFCSTVFTVSKNGTTLKTAQSKFLTEDGDPLANWDGAVPESIGKSLTLFQKQHLRKFGFFFSLSLALVISAVQFYTVFLPMQKENRP